MFAKHVLIYVRELQHSNLPPTVHMAALSSKDLAGPLHKWKCQLQTKSFSFFFPNPSSNISFYLSSL